MIPVTMGEENEFNAARINVETLHVSHKRADAARRAAVNEDAAFAAQQVAVANAERDAMKGESHGYS
jgi:hypothetical protein